MDPGDRDSADGAAASGDAAVEKIRIPFIRRARVTRAGRADDAFLIDLGLKGVFVERAEPLPIGEEVAIEFHLPGNERPVVARCRVAWWHPAEMSLLSKSLPSGIGLQFAAIDGDGRQRLRRYVLEYLGRSPRQRRFNRWPEESREDRR